MLQTQRDNRCQQRLLYQAKFSITIDGENKIFHNKAKKIRHSKMKSNLNTVCMFKSTLQKVLDGKLQPKKANYIHENTGKK